MSGPSELSIVPSSTFASLQARRVTETHLLRINGFSAASRWMPSRESIDSSTFSACGHKWKLSYYPNGEDRKRGPASVKIQLKDGNKYKDDVTAACRLSILDRDGNTAYSYYLGPHRYRWKSMSTSATVLATPEEREAVLRLTKDDSLAIRCDITMLRIDKEPRFLWYLRKFLD